MVVVREALIEDAAELGRMHVESWRWAYAGLLPAEVLAGLSVAERTARWREILASAERSVTFVATGPDVVGFASAGPARPDAGGPAVGELYGIYLAEHVAGIGIGRMLQDEAQGWLRAQGFTEARLWVLRDNQRARRFYERCGWRTDGAEKLERRPEGFLLDQVRYRRDLPDPTPP